MPNIQTLLDGLHGSAVYTSLDLFSGYYNIMVAEQDQEKTAFIVPGGGQFKFRRLPFGLCNAPATFSSVVDTIFNDIKMKYVLPYLDDFVIYSPDYSTHLIHLKEVLFRIKMAGLKLKPSKCNFVQNKVTFLGQRVSAAGVETRRR